MIPEKHAELSCPECEQMGVIGMATVMLIIPSEASVRWCSRGHVSVWHRESPVWKEVYNFYTPEFTPRKPIII